MDELSLALSSINIVTILTLVWLHFLGDFILQTDQMAMEKSSDWRMLTIHAGVYSIGFIVVFGHTYGIVNLVLHWCIDGISSRITSKLWKSKRCNAFFTTIGADQAIHMSCLMITYHLMFGV